MVNNKINVNVIDGLQPILDRIVDYDNITNCITEIPQDIKLELADGVLTLKAGSKVYVPNGVGVFDAVTIASDTIYNTVTNTTGRSLFFLYPDLTIGAFTAPDDAVVNFYFSGPTAPTITNTYAVWYDTTNNIMKYTFDNGATWTSGVSLPLSICSYTSGTGVTSIDQVFNGFGYIGSTVFALPGVKGLIPNGRNADGSLKNIEFTIPSVKTVNNSVTANNLCLCIGSNGNSIWDGYTYVESETQPTSNYVLWYNPIANTCKWRSTGNFSNSNCLYVGRHNRADGVITSFTPKLPFRAIDQNDFNRLVEEVDTLDAQNVKLTGNQTVGGDKTFSGFSRYTGATVIRNLNDDSTIAPTEQIYYQWGMEDKNGVWLGGFEGNHLTDGSYTKGMYIKQQGGDTYSALFVGIRPDGSTFTQAPTPATSDNSTQIATTAYVKAQIQQVSAAPSSYTTGVLYVIPE